MIIYATADLDPLGNKLEPFWKVIKKLKEPDLLLFAGDMYRYKNPEQYKEILELIEKLNWKCPIVACFGNREFEEDYSKIRKYCRRKIRFLDDKSITIKIDKKSVGIVGTKGSLDIPTWWQAMHIRNIRSIYEDRLEKVRTMLKKLKTSIKILLMHYSPTYKTLKGENPRAYGGLGSRKFEPIISETKPTFVVHGHAHYGTSLAFIDSVPVFNVAFPITKKIIEINTDKLPKTGLRRFL